MKITVWLGLALLCVGSVVSADEPKAKEMSAQEKAQMEAWMKAATPGEAHKKLDAMAGTWSVTVSSWMAPGAPVMTSEGTAENSWTLDGRWMQQNFHGSMMGMPFAGLGYTGYDNIRKQYVSTWMDNMSTSMMVTTGQAEKDGSWTFTGSMDDPMSGKSMPVRNVVQVVDHDHHRFEMWGPGPDGKDFKMMEIAYTRKK